ncbi:MAG: DUF488 domain-containing protein [Desulfotomaculales bacterium]
MRRRILETPLQLEVRYLPGPSERPGKPVIYTLGTSTRTLREFLEILKRYDIALVVDVRRFPASRRYPHFNRSNLAAQLAVNSLAYHYFGDKLGGYRQGGYEAYTRTETFREGIEKLASLAKRTPTAILCSERFPWKCHRRFIAVALAAKGWKVVHILDADRVYTPPEPGCNASPASQGFPASNSEK